MFWRGEHLEPSGDPALELPAPSRRVREVGALAGRRGQQTILPRQKHGAY